MIDVLRMLFPFAVGGLVGLLYVALLMWLFDFVGGRWNNRRPSPRAARAEINAIRRDTVHRLMAMERRLDRQGRLARRSSFYDNDADVIDIAEDRP